MQDVDPLPAAVAPGSPWSRAAVQELRPGEVLVREGDDGDDVFEVVSGRLEILRGPTDDRIDVSGPGTTLGEIAALAGCRRTATIRALDHTVLRRLDGDTYRRWLALDDGALAALTDAARARIDRHRTIALVAELLALAPETAATIVDRGEFVQLAMGELLFTEGDASDAAYLVVSGRLRATRAGSPVGEIARGETAGEIGVLERTARSATLTAVRDTTLCRFDLEAFSALTAAYPALMIRLVRTIVARAGRPVGDRARSIAVAITAPHLDHGYAATMADELGRHGRTRHLDADAIDAALGRTGIVESGLSVTRPAIAEHLEAAEADHDYLLLETAADDGRWTRQALALADRIVVVMSARPDADELRSVAAALAAVPGRTGAERWLAIIHPAGTARPTGGGELADRFGVARVVHLRAGSPADLQRLARLVSGTATGLVLGGGGARGFAHLGVWRALGELGIDVDAIGGASIGAPLGAAMALQLPPDELLTMSTELFRGLLDYTVPIVSLVKGQRIRRNIAAVFGGVDLRDLWLPFFCVSTNITRSRLEVHDRADAATAIRASVALPGILPPVALGGDLLVDGGVLNNLPCDVMRATGTVGHLIAVDLAQAGPGVRDDVDRRHRVPGWRTLRGRRAPARLPSAVAVVMRALVAGSARDRDRMLASGIVDWHLDLDMPGVHLLDFERVAEIAGRGYVAARPRLEAWLRGSAP